MSEVARLRQQIEQEIESMRMDFTGYAAGGARHDFIRAKMERVGGHQEKLAENIGEKQAAMAVCEIYIRVMLLRHAESRSPVDRLSQQSKVEGGRESKEFVCSARSPVAIRPFPLTLLPHLPCQIIIATFVVDTFAINHSHIYTRMVTSHSTIQQIFPCGTTCKN